MKIRPHISGMNPNDWVHPYERGTTRGWSVTPFPTMHSKEVEQTMKVATCECCGQSFGFTETDKPRRFCPSHLWLGQVNPLGKLYVTDIRYPGIYHPETEVTGRLVRYSYFYPEENPNEKQKLQMGIRDWLRERFLEQIGLDRLPKAHITDHGVLVTDVQHLQSQFEKLGGSQISQRSLTAIMALLDDVYVETL